MPAKHLHQCVQDKFTAENHRGNYYLALFVKNLGLKATGQGEVTTIHSGSTELGRIETNRVFLYFLFFREYLKNRLPQMGAQQLHLQVSSANAKFQDFDKSYVELISRVLRSCPTLFSDDMRMLLEKRVAVDKLAQQHFPFLSIVRIEKARLFASVLTDMVFTVSAGVEALLYKAKKFEKMLANPELIEALTVDGVVDRRLERHAKLNRLAKSDMINAFDIADYDERTKIQAAIQAINDFNHHLFTTLFSLWGVRSSYPIAKEAAQGSFAEVKSKLDACLAYYSERGAKTYQEKITAVKQLLILMETLMASACVEQADYDAAYAQLRANAEDNSALSSAQALVILRHHAIARCTDTQSDTLRPDYDRLVRCLAEAEPYLKNVARVCARELAGEYQSQAAQALAQNLFIPSLRQVSSARPSRRAAVTPLLVDFAAVKTIEELQREWQRVNSCEVTGFVIAKGARFRSGYQFTLDVLPTVPVAGAIAAMADLATSKASYAERKCVAGLNDVIQHFNQGNVRAAKRQYRTVECSLAPITVKNKYCEFGHLVNCFSSYHNGLELYKQRRFQGALDVCLENGNCDDTFSGAFDQLTRASECSAALQLFYENIKQALYGEAERLMHPAVMACEGFSDAHDFAAKIKHIVYCMKGLELVRNKLHRTEYSAVLHDLDELRQTCQGTTRGLMSTHENYYANADCGVNLQAAVVAMDGKAFPEAKEILTRSLCQQAAPVMQQDYSRIQCEVSVLARQQALENSYNLRNVESCLLDWLHVFPRVFVKLSKKVERGLLAAYYLCSFGNFFWRMGLLQAIKENKEALIVCNEKNQTTIQELSLLQTLQTVSLISLGADCCGAAMRANTSAGEFGWRDHLIVSSRMLTHSVLFACSLSFILQSEKQSLAENLFSNWYFLSMYAAKYLLIGYDFFSRRDRARQTDEGSPKVYAPKVKAVIEGHFAPSKKGLLLIPIIYRAIQVNLTENFTAYANPIWQFLISSLQSLCDQFWQTQTVKNLQGALAPVLTEYMQFIGSTLFGSLSGLLNQVSDKTTLGLQTLPSMTTIYSWSEYCYGDKILIISIMAAVYAECYSKYKQQTRDERNPSNAFA